jgi:hypothetical protein
MPPFGILVGSPSSSCVVAPLTICNGDTPTVLSFLLQLYRDCLRLVRHIAPGATSAKALALQRTVRHEFRKNAHVTKAEELDNLKANAVRALSNYLLAVSAPKDAGLQSTAKNFHGRSVKEAQAVKEERGRATSDVDPTTEGR